MSILHFSLVALLLCTHLVLALPTPPSPLRTLPEHEVDDFIGSLLEPGEASHLSDTKGIEPIHFPPEVHAWLNEFHPLSPARSPPRPEPPPSTSTRRRKGPSSTLKPKMTSPQEWREHTSHVHELVGHVPSKGKRLDAEQCVTAAWASRALNRSAHRKRNGQELLTDEEILAMKPSPQSAHEFCANKRALSSEFKARSKTSAVTTSPSAWVEHLKLIEGLTGHVAQRGKKLEADQIIPAAWSFKATKLSTEKRRISQPLPSVEEMQRLKPTSEQAQEIVARRRHAAIRSNQANASKDKGVTSSVDDGKV